jgi:hypothetical protein
MDDFYKKLIIAGVATLAITAESFFNMGYQKGKEIQKKQDSEEIINYAKAFMDKGIYWQLSAREAHEFSLFTQDIKLLNNAMQDTSKDLHSIEKALLKRAQ